jgi:hypothetical protein
LHGRYVGHHHDLSTTEEARETAPLLRFWPLFKALRRHADIDCVSVTLSPPVRIAALVAALVLTGLAAAVFLLGRGFVGEDPAAATTPAPAVKATPKPATTPRANATPRPNPKPRVASGLPPKIDHALRYSRVVVVSVTVPGAAVDTVVRGEARDAAKASRAGFVSITTANERALSGLVAKTGILPAPAVVVVRRPGVVTAIFSVTDAATISQAVAQARR